ncbi:glycosyltransferase family 2 protein [bacterium BMS3Abin03]|nr:glycosyltransferase family 2 protein [bacterium BMS3Abin03]
MEFNFILTVIFLTLVYLLLHTYIIYPVLILIISSFYKKHSIKGGKQFPEISILISAFNEEKVIENRVQNIARLDYDFNKLEVIVGSDSSTDKTNLILQDLCKKYHWLKVKIFKNRRGKAAVLNDLVNDSKNPILVFTDANTTFKKDSLVRLVKHFSDVQIGGVCGRLILTEPQRGFNKSNKEKTYWEYETFLKSFEGKMGMLMGANGGIFSIRRILFDEIPINKPVTDDLFITLSILKKKFKFIFDYNAIAYEEVPKEIKSEFNRKVRFAATNFQTLLIFKSLLISKNLLLSFVFWSHKVIRWIMPFALVLIFLINILLIGYSEIFLKLFYFQVIVHSLSIIGYFLSLLRIRLPLITLIFFFNFTNLALFIGFFRFLFRKHSYIWESTPR